MASYPPDHQPILDPCPPRPKRFWRWKWMASTHKWARTGLNDAYPLRYGDWWEEVECVKCGERTTIDHPGGP